MVEQNCGQSYQRGISKEEALGNGICSNTSQPFVHKFETPKHKYLFDVNTGRILRVDVVTWDIIEDVGVLTVEEAVEKYQSVYDKDRIRSAYMDVVHVQNHDGLLLIKYPDAITLPVTIKDIETAMGIGRRKLILCVTENCNFRCKYCLYGGKYNSWPVHSDKCMTWEIAHRAIKDFLDHGSYYENSSKRIRTISFYGGEPLIAFPLIKQCISYVRRKVKSEIDFQITTNGSLLKDDVADYLATERVRICVSLDGPKHIHDINRRFLNGSGTWDTVKQNIEVFLKDHPEYKVNGRFSTNSVLGPSANVMEVNDFFTSPEIFPPAVKVNVDPMSPFGWNNSTGLGTTSHIPHSTYSLLSDFLGKLASGSVNKDPDNITWRMQRSLFERSYLQIHKRIVTDDCLTLSRELIGPRSMCIPGMHTLLVAASGSYYPCERVPSASGLEIGNVWSGMDIPRIYELMQKFYEFNREQCSRCWCVVQCSVGCFANIVVGGVLSDEGKQVQCSTHRISHHHTLAEYCEILESTGEAFDDMARITVE